MSKINKQGYGLARKGHGNAVFVLGLPLSAESLRLSKVLYGEFALMKRLQRVSNCIGKFDV